MGGSSSSRTSSNTEVNVGVEVQNVIDFDELSNAINKNIESDKGIAEANAVIEIAKAQAELNQKELFFNEAEAGIKKYALLGVLGFGAYKIMKKKGK